MQTADGAARKVCVRPPKDIWEFLSQEEYEKAQKVAGTQGWFNLVWNLLRPVYGLKDAPLLWIMSLYKFISEVTVYIGNVAAKCSRIWWR